MSEYGGKVVDDLVVELVDRLVAEEERGRDEEEAERGRERLCCAQRAERRRNERERRAQEGSVVCVCVF